MVDITNRE